MLIPFCALAVVLNKATRRVRSKTAACMNNQFLRIAALRGTARAAIARVTVYVCKCLTAGFKPFWRQRWR